MSTIMTPSSSHLHPTNEMQAEQQQQQQQHQLNHHETSSQGINERLTQDHRKQDYNHNDEAKQGRHRPNEHRSHQASVISKIVHVNSGSSSSSSIGSRRLRQFLHTILLLFPVTLCNNYVTLTGSSPINSRYSSASIKRFDDHDNELARTLDRINNHDDDEHQQHQQLLAHFGQDQLLESAKPPAHLLTGSAQINHHQTPSPVATAPGSVSPLQLPSLSSSSSSSDARHSAPMDSAESEHKYISVLNNQSSIVTNAARRDASPDARNAKPTIRATKTTRPLGGDHKQDPTTTTASSTTTTASLPVRTTTTTMETPSSGPKPTPTPNHTRDMDTDKDTFLLAYNDDNVSNGLNHSHIARGPKRDRILHRKNSIPAASFKSRRSNLASMSNANNGNQLGLPKSLSSFAKNQQRQQSSAIHYHDHGLESGRREVANEAVHEREPFRAGQIRSVFSPSLAVGDRAGDRRAPSAAAFAMDLSNVNGIKKLEPKQQHQHQMDSASSSCSRIAIAIVPLQQNEHTNCSRYTNNIYSDNPNPSNPNQSQSISDNRTMAPQSSGELATGASTTSSTTTTTANTNTNMNTASNGNNNNIEESMISNSEPTNSDDANQMTGSHMDSDGSGNQDNEAANAESNSESDMDTTTTNNGSTGRPDSSFDLNSSFKNSTSQLDASNSNDHELASDSAGETESSSNGLGDELGDSTAAKALVPASASGADQLGLHEVLVGPFKSESEAPNTITLSGVVYQKSTLADKPLAAPAASRLAAPTRHQHQRHIMFPSAGSELQHQQHQRHQHLILMPSTAKSSAVSVDDDDIASSSDSMPNKDSLTTSWSHQGAGSSRLALAKYRYKQPAAQVALSVEPDAQVAQDSASLGKLVVMAKSAPQAQAARSKQLAAKQLVRVVARNPTTGETRSASVHLVPVRLRHASGDATATTIAELGAPSHNHQSHAVAEMSLFGRHPATLLASPSAMSTSHVTLLTPGPARLVVPASSGGASAMSGSGAAKSSASDYTKISISGLPSLASAMASLQQGVAGAQEASSGGSSKEQKAQDLEAALSSLEWQHPSISSSSSSSAKGSLGAASAGSLASDDPYLASLLNDMAGSESKHSYGHQGSKKDKNSIVIVEKNVKPVKYHLLRAYLTLRRLLRPADATYVFPNQGSDPFLNKRHEQPPRAPTGVA